MRVIFLDINLRLLAEFDVRIDDITGYSLRYSRSNSASRGDVVSKKTWSVSFRKG